MSYHIIAKRNIIFSILKMLHGNYSNGQSLQFFSIFWSSREKNTVSLFNPKIIRYFSWKTLHRRVFVKTLAHHIMHIHKHHSTHVDSARIDWIRIHSTRIDSIRVPIQYLQHVSIQQVSVPCISIQTYPFHTYPFKPCHCISYHIIGSAYQCIIRHGNEFGKSSHQQELKQNLQKDILHTNCNESQ